MTENSTKKFRKNKQNQSETQKKHREEFIKDYKKLFDIANADRGEWGKVTWLKKNVYCNHSLAKIIIIFDFSG